MIQTRTQTYAGVDQEDNHGMTLTGRIIRDAWVFDIVPEGNTFAGKTAGDLQNLFEQVHQAWEPYGQLPSRLPPELAERHARIHAQAVALAKAAGWSAELGDDD
ncbi:hypothetical protein [Hydrogenophaga sp.]|jgi:hypothetical protein|uniref:hypothetical protein n=1 Tax=Hydrogenophaga sp. TaxID=1904254 RepID=UPI002616427E|nr:hypothetical protein [Hydrogenophaga sp.]MDM7950047.1 hypothetical protein [Hydrogenophaga sp.]